MNQTKITAFGGAVHDDSELQDGNETMSIEEFLNTVLGRLLQIQIKFFSLREGGRPYEIGISVGLLIFIPQKVLDRDLSVCLLIPLTLN